MTFDGKAMQTSSADLVEGRKTGPLVDVRFDVEAVLAVPPWVQGTLDKESSKQLETSLVGDLMGGPRYEQLFRASGLLQVEGEHHSFTGSGLRIRRQGVRKLEGLLGALLAVGVVPQRPRVRLHRLPASARRRTRVQRGLRVRAVMAT